MSSSFWLSVGFSFLIDNPFLMRVSTISPQTVFKFTAVTSVESDAAWLLACCRSDVFFYSIMEAVLGEANIVVCTVADIFVDNIA